MRRTETPPLAINTPSNQVKLPERRISQPSPLDSYKQAWKETMAGVRNAVSYTTRKKPVTFPKNHSTEGTPNYAKPITTRRKAGILVPIALAAAGCVSAGGGTPASAPVSVSSPSSVASLSSTIPAAAALTDLETAFHNPNYNKSPVFFEVSGGGGHIQFGKKNAGTAKGSVAANLHGIPLGPLEGKIGLEADTEVKTGSSPLDRKTAGAGLTLGVQSTPDVSRSFAFDIEGGLGGAHKDWLDQDPLLTAIGKAEVGFRLSPSLGLVVGGKGEIELEPGGEFAKTSAEGKAGIRWINSNQDELLKRVGIFAVSVRETLGDWARISFPGIDGERRTDIVEHIIKLGGGVSIELGDVVIEIVCVNTKSSLERDRPANKPVGSLEVEEKNLEGWELFTRVGLKF